MSRRSNHQIIIIFIRLIWIYYFPLVFPSTSTCRIYIAGQYVHTHVTNKSIFASNVTDKIFKNVRRRPGHSDTLLYIYRGWTIACVSRWAVWVLSYTQMSISISAVCRRCVTPCVCLVYLPIGVPVVWVLSTGEKTFFSKTVSLLSLYLSIYLARHLLHRDTLATNRKTWNLDFDVGQRQEPKFNRRPHSPASLYNVRIRACLPSLREKSISIYSF